MELDGLSDYLQGVADKMRNTKPLMYSAGMALRDSLRGHFIGRGGKSFWKGIARATNLTDYSDTHATVTVGGDEGTMLLHKISGGDIFPKNPRKNLAIPATDEARQAGYPSGGNTPPLVPLFCWKDGKPRVYALASAEGVNVKTQTKRGKTVVHKFKEKKNRVGMVWYWLVPKVHQLADADALPPQAQLEADVIARLELRIASLLGFQR